MSEPRRLKHGGGAAQRLLDSASLDRAGAKSRERVRAIMSTSSAFSQTTRDAARPRGVLRTFATWAAVGAAASVALGFAVSRLAVGPSDDPVGSAPQIGELTNHPAPLEIAAEPERTGEVEPWVVLSSLSEPPAEVIALRPAISALSAHDSAGALRAIEAYDVAYPSGQLRTEASALRVQALLLAGRISEARGAGAVWLQEHGGHPLAARVRGAAP